MAVLLETSKGDIVIDLYVEEAPSTCKNFLKLCKVKYYNNCLFHNVQRNFIAQTGDPTGTGRGGESVYGLMYGSQARFFDDEISPKRKHTVKGTVGMASAGPGLNASQFYFTLSDSLDSLDEKHTVFGTVSEGVEVLEAMNEVPVDDAGRPLQNIRIRHTIILEDPYDDPPQLTELMPDASPEPKFEHGDRLEEDWVPEQDDRPAEEVEKETRAAEAKNRAVVLEMIGDLPEADVKPPSNVLFVCKLNPVTTEEDLEIIFGRFGTITDCDIIRDYKTGDSLCYAFIGYDNDQSCEAAYFKMNNVLIDDRRIKVDFSQSVSHIWKQFKRHGKKGGTADMAAEAAGHDRAGQGGGTGGRSGRFEQRGGGGDRGLLLGHPDEQLLQQQQHRQQQVSMEHDARRSAGSSRGRDPAVARHSGDDSRYRKSRSRSRGRRASNRSSRSRSRSREASRKHKSKHKKDKHKSRDRSRSREAEPAGRRSDRPISTQQLDRHEGEQYDRHRSREDDDRRRSRAEEYQRDRSSYREERRDSSRGYRDERERDVRDSRGRSSHEERDRRDYRCRSDR